MIDLFKAAHDNNVLAVQSGIDEGQDINAQHPRAGTIPLMLACQGNAIDALRLLIKSGANPSLKFTRVSRIDGHVFKDHFPLLYAESVAVAELLLDAGADINARDSDGCTALFNAIHATNIELCAYLLDRGARTDIELRWHGEAMLLSAFVTKFRAFCAEADRENPNETARTTIDQLDKIRALLIARGCPMPTGEFNSEVRHLSELGE
ncbi:MAG: ankyrin repeat domain-containing protein [Xanthomonadales bacterium]|nr:ankyrin repeat domain-containing protein [Xanthomonadales bacterium]